MYLIADAHVSTNQENHYDFFAMLARIAHSREDIIFLGDIFDLWIGLERHEEDIHLRFLTWCREQKSHRKIGFIEGNHEFFVARTHHACFSWADTSELKTQVAGLQVTFCHGDLINPEDVHYHRFRKLTKNPYTRILVNYMPFAQRFVARIKASMERKHQGFGHRLPETQINHFAQNQFDKGTDLILCGHFHRPYQFAPTEGKRLVILPDWLSSGAIVHLCEQSGRLKTLAWQELSVPDDANGASTNPTE